LLSKSIASGKYLINQFIKMKVSELLREYGELPTIATPGYLAGKLHKWYRNLNYKKKRNMQELAIGTAKRWNLQVHALKRAGVDLKDHDELLNQLNTWTKRFFKSDTITPANDMDVRDPVSIKHYLFRTVYARLAGLDNQANNAANAPTTAQPTTQQTPQVTGAPIGTILTVNAGKYTKTANGWANENGKVITNPNSAQYLENVYNKKQGNQTP
jgi:hypothetical protein